MKENTTLKIIKKTVQLLRLDRQINDKISYTCKHNGERIVLHAFDYTGAYASDITMPKKYFDFIYQSDKNFEKVSEIPINRLSMALFSYHYSIIRKEELKNIMTTVKVEHGLQYIVFEGQQTSLIIHIISHGNVEYKLTFNQLSIDCTKSSNDSYINPYDYQYLNDVFKVLMKNKEFRNNIAAINFYIQPSGILYIRLVFQEIVIRVAIAPYEQNVLSDFIQTPIIVKHELYEPNMEKDFINRFVCAVCKKDLKE